MDFNTSRSKPFTTVCVEINMFKLHFIKRHMLNCETFDSLKIHSVPDYRLIKMHFYMGCPATRWSSMLHLLHFRSISRIFVMDQFIFEVIPPPSVAPRPVCNHLLHSFASPTAILLRHIEFALTAHSQHL